MKHLAGLITAGLAAISLPTAALVPGSEPGTIGTLPRVLVGSAPQDAAFDPATRTIYVANAGDNTLSVISARACNSRDLTGCRHRPVTVAAGSGANGVVVDDATHTVYVTDGGGNTVSVINAATCNAADTSGCGQAPVTVAAGQGPAGVAIDLATDTLYVTDNGPGVNGTGDTVSVINGATCNAVDTSGCGQTPAAVTVGPSPFSTAFDAATRTVYVTNLEGKSVSMINAVTCNATVSSGCDQVPPIVRVGNLPVPVTVDRRTNTVYVGNNGDATVSVIDAARCNATRTTGCRHLGIVRLLGGPSGLTVDDATRTLFASNDSTATGALGPGRNASRADSVSVIDAANCNGLDTSGCGLRAPAALAGAAPGPGVIDQATDTLYVVTGDNALTIIDGATCQARMTTGCGQPVPATMAGADPFSVAAEPATHTLYVGNFGSPTISLIDTATCNTVVSSGCRPRRPAITLRGAAYGLAVDQATDTIYATNIVTASGQPGSTVSVVDGARCDAADTRGCRKAMPAIRVGPDPAGIAVNRATDTVYVANSGSTTVAVINGAVCNSRVTSGCHRRPRQVHVRRSPLAVAVNQVTDTIYVLSPGTPSTVSVIDGAACNATVAVGCGKTPPTVTAGPLATSKASRSTSRPTRSTS